MSTPPLPLLPSSKGRSLKRSARPRLPIAPVDQRRLNREQDQDGEQRASNDDEGYPWLPVHFFALSPISTSRAKEGVNRTCDRMRPWTSKRLPFLQPLNLRA